MTIDPGLIDINMGYGYMRAGDMVAVGDSLRNYAVQLSDQITRLRQDCCDLEYPSMA